MNITGVIGTNNFCHSAYDAETWNKTVEREEILKLLGYNVISTTSCEWKKMPESRESYARQPQSEDSPNTTMQTILDDVMSEKIFGFVECDIHVPEDLVDKFSEFPPIFKNTEITMTDIGDHMREFCRKTTRRTGVKRSLISSMHAKGILLLTTLLKKYLEMGLVVTNVETVIVYNGKSVFNGFRMKYVVIDGEQI